MGETTSIDRQLDCIDKLSRSPENMLTRIEIDGFKSFRGFSLEISPLQAIVGPNSAGKSNLFDALQLVARLSCMDAYSAMK